MDTKKRSISLILAIFMLLAMVCGAWALTPNADGVYEIGTPAELAKFRDGINDGSISRDVDAKLTANIDLSHFDWTPIGQHVLSVTQVALITADSNITADRSYAGTFDGAGFRITGLTASATNVVPYENQDASGYHFAQAGGLFGVVGDGGTVKNLTLSGVKLLLDTDENERIYAGAVAGGNYGTVQNVSALSGTVHGLYAGGLVGRSGGTIMNSVVSGLQVVGAMHAGGIVARNEAVGQVITCTAQHLRVDGVNFVGGIAGLSDGGVISGCTVSGAMTAIVSRGGTSNSRTGGIVGSDAGAAIENCLVQDILSISGYVAGGIVGRSNGNVINNCVASGIGEIVADSYAGGIAGLLGGADVSNCIASDIGRITSLSATSGTGAGGIVGRVAAGTVANCAAYEIGTIKGNSAGGVIGWFHSTTSNLMQNCVAFGIDTIDGDTNKFGGVIGTNNNSDATAAADSRYAYDIVSIDRGTGNVARPGTNITSYDASDPANTLDAYVVTLSQGAMHTMAVGDTYEIDVTGLPGILGLSSATVAWSTENLGFVSIASSADGLKVTVTALADGTENVKCTVNTALVSAVLHCQIQVTEDGEVEPVITGTPEDGTIYPGDVVNLTYDFSPYIAIPDIDNTLMDGSGLLAAISNGKVVLTGTASQNSGVYYYVVKLQGTDGSIITQTVSVVIQGGSRPTGGGGSSNCNSGVGSALFALLGLAFVYKKK